jgi:phage shock protein A
MYVNEYVLMAFAFLLVMTPVVVMLMLAEEERRHEAYARQLQIQIGKQRGEIDSLRQRNDHLETRWEDACAEMWVQASQKAEAEVAAELDSLRRRLHGYDLDMAGMSAMLESRRSEDQRILDVASAFHEA